MGETSEFNDNLLKLYYDKLFPVHLFTKWLNYSTSGSSDSSGSGLLSKREFSFTVAGEIYIRYLSFKDAEEFSKELKRKVPHKIDIGAIYNIPPKDHHTVRQQGFIAKQRELVFDIDLTDYDEVRRIDPDCNEGLWQKNAWQYMAVAIKIVTEMLRNDFGYKNILWVFSGRRGVHCWVCDESARLLTDQQRASLVKYITLIAGKNVEVSSPMHPGVARFMPMLTEVFEKYVISGKSQGLLSDMKKCEDILSLVPNESVRQRLDYHWKSQETSVKVEDISTKRWEELKATVVDEAASLAKKAQRFAATELKLCLEKIIIFYVYPRLDVNVSTHRNHLLKAPFVVHPKTGKICVPIFDVDHCENFDPDDVPTLSGLINNLESINPADLDETSEKPAKKSKTGGDKNKSLKPFLDLFEEKFLTPLLATKNDITAATTKNTVTTPVKAKPGSLVW